MRLLDANANRALEGLRVCEDILRFHFGQPRAVRRLRALRHAVALAVAEVPVEIHARLRARDSTRDVGRTAPPTPIRSLERLLLINFQRAKESLRVLEECARLIAPRQSSSFQRLRFRTYEVEREIILGLAPLRHS